MDRNVVSKHLIQFLLSFLLTSLERSTQTQTHPNLLSSKHPTFSGKMGIRNYSGAVVQAKSFEEIRCSMVLTSGIHEILTYILLLNIIISVTAFIGNTLILVALGKDSSLPTPSRLLLRCLAITDLCVALIVEPLNITYLTSIINYDVNLCRFSAVASFMAGYMLGSVSLLTLTGISVDRLLALFMWLRYREIVTVKRTFVVLTTFWVLSSLVSATYLVGHQITFWYGRIVITLCLVTAILSYTKIFFAIRRHQIDVKQRTQQQQTNQTILNIARYRKAVYTALWVQAVLVVCYLPYSIVIALFSHESISSSYFVSWTVTVSLVYLNSSLNPFLYCWRISEIRQVIKGTIRQAFNCIWN